MGGYYCDRCNQSRHTDDHGYHHATEPNGGVYEFCDDCLVSVLEAHAEMHHPLASIDGADMAEHFVCWTCMEVVPNAERAEHDHRPPSSREERTWPEPVTPYTAEEVRDRYLANCRERSHPPFVPFQCHECRYPILMMEADAIMAGGGWYLTGCRGCGRSYCD